jgi:NAD(P)-dependent dehydrogenase (short-subunit alcohol dehydrogenase family)
MSDTQRVAIVTGAADGVGRAMTRGLLAGIRVAGSIATVSRSRPLWQAHVSRERRPNCSRPRLDLTSDSAADEITRATRARFRASLRLDGRLQLSPTECESRRRRAQHGRRQ